MPANEDLTADAVAVSPVPFVVTHPCTACHGQGMIDGHACPGRYASGVSWFNTAPLDKCRVEIIGAISGGTSTW